VLLLDRHEHHILARNLSLLRLLRAVYFDSDFVGNRPDIARREILIALDESPDW
jgi:hypothetical protein